MESSEKEWDTLDYAKTLPAFILAGIIFYFSSLSNPLPTPPGGPPDVFDLNTLLHVAEYAVLSFFVSFGFFPKIKAKYINFSCILYAISDEIHQYFVPNRYFDPYDILMDSIGVVLGFIAFFILYSLLNKIKANN